MPTRTTPAPEVPASSLYLGYPRCLPRASSKRKSPSLRRHSLTHLLQLSRDILRIKKILYCMLSQHSSFPQSMPATPHMLATTPSSRLLDLVKPSTTLSPNKSKPTSWVASSACIPRRLSHLSTSPLFTLTGPPSPVRAAPCPTTPPPSSRPRQSPRVPA